MQAEHLDSAPLRALGSAWFAVYQRQWRPSVLQARLRVWTSQRWVSPLWPGFQISWRLQLGAHDEAEAKKPEAGGIRKMKRAHALWE